MTLLHRIRGWLDPKPKRDPKVDRIMSASRTTQIRRERSHASLMAFLDREQDTDRETRNGHAD